MLDLYLRAFHLCDMYLDWEPQGDVAAGGLQPSFEFIQMNFPDKKRAWSFGVADISFNLSRETLDTWKAIAHYFSFW